LQRVRVLLGEDGEDLDALDAAALAVSPLEVRGLVLEVTSEGVVVKGANENTRPEHIWRSALEHVTREAKLTHVAMSRLSGPLRQLVVTGGWSNSRAPATREARHDRPVGALWCQPGRLSWRGPPRGSGRWSV